MNSQTKTECVIFDLGGVLVDWKSAVNAIGEHVNLPPDIVLKKINSKTPLLDIGKLEPNDFWIEFDSALEQKSEPEILAEIWLKNHFIIKPTWDILYGLKGKYKIALLTNMWKGYFEKIIENVGADISYIDVILDSSVIGYRKPEKAIYDHVESSLRFSDLNFFFIDDMESNLVEPENRGWSTFLFRTDEVDNSVSELQKKLQ